MVKLHFQRSFFLIYEALQINIVYQQSNIISSDSQYIYIYIYILSVLKIHLLLKD